MRAASRTIWLDWRMGPSALPSDQIVRDAARIVLDHKGPCRVVDGDKVVGVVDDEDILRVVVAEEES